MTAMKKIIVALLFVVLHKIMIAQNVGIGTTEPMNKMHIVGNLLVNTPTSATSTPPTVAQTKTLPGLGSIAFLSTDSTGRLYDPGGPAGNYGIDLSSSATIPSSLNIAFEITAETMNLNTGDSLIIKESSGGLTLLAIGNGYNTPGKWVFNSYALHIQFKSNTDFNVGAGFSLLIKRLYDNSASLPGVSGVTGNALFFDTKNGSFRSGLINNAASGNYSTAMGLETTASGNNSTAMGHQTEASGPYSTAMGSSTAASETFSTAMGRSTTASGYASTAMGNNTTATGSASTAMGFSTDANGTYSTAMGGYTMASGEISTAMGYQTEAGGSYSTAMGRSTIASGHNSTAMGNYVSTNNQEGSFVIGDNSTTTVLNSANANNFRARFAGGYKLFTSANLSTGCTLFAGDNAWTTGSDVRTKENFAEVNGEDFLKKIASMRLVSWNYKKQDASKFRHYGPMAQEFYAAFGKDKYGNIGNDTTINQADFDGVNLIAIQALEKRTQKIEALEKRTADQKKEIDELKVIILQLQKDLKRVEENKNLYNTSKE